MPSQVLSRRLRWAAPALAAGVVVAVVAVPGGGSASAESLAPRTAADLVAAVSNASAPGISGTVVATTRLGLPELPTGSGAGGGSALSLQDLLAGSTTARLWASGEDKLRLAVDAPFAEYDIVRDGSDLWTYDSASSDVSHVTIPDTGEEPEPTPGAVTPDQAAQSALAAIDPTTEATVGPVTTVAGRPAYELVLTPRDAETLVAGVRIAIDGETSVPLRVRVYADGQEAPAVEVGFTSVRFSVPDASVFRFVPPSGSTVTERELPSAAVGVDRDDVERRAAEDVPQLFGAGWNTVLSTSAGELPQELISTLGQLAEPVDGGRAVQTTLVTVLLLDDGRVFAGALTPERLLEIATTR